MFFQDNTPALTYKVAEDFFENNLNEERDNYEFSEGFYSRTIDQNELVLAFDAVDDG